MRTFAALLVTLLGAAAVWPFGLEFARWLNSLVGGSAVAWTAIGWCAVFVWGIIASEIFGGDLTRRH